MELLIGHIIGNVKAISICDIDILGTCKPSRCKSQLYGFVIHSAVVGPAQPANNQIHYENPTCTSTFVHKPYASASPELLRTPHLGILEKVPAKDKTFLRIVVLRSISRSQTRQRCLGGLGIERKVVYSFQWNEFSCNDLTANACHSFSYRACNDVLDVWANALP